MGGEDGPVAFDGDFIVSMIETVKSENDYDKKTLEGKMAFKADVILEFTEKIVDLIRRAFLDVPEFDPMFMGQHIRLTMERLFPNYMEDMQFRWVPHLLSMKTAPEFPVCLESSRYVPLRREAHRLTQEPGFKELAEEERQYLINVNDGRMPPGVFGSHHSAWLICDPLKANEPLNQGAVNRFLEEQKLPSGSAPKTEAEIIEELSEVIQE